MSVMVLMGSFELGIIYAIMALGVFISFRTLNMPDLSVDGSFVLGAAVSAVMTLSGHPFLALGVAFIAGCGAGSITALLHTKLKIQPLLAGILTMLALYSLNLKVMDGRANIPLINKVTVFSALQETAIGDYSKLVFSLAVLTLLLLILFLFLKTRLGFVLRATGDNDHMVRALGVNTDSVILVGLAISNGLVAVAGALIAQSQSYVDVGMGIGMVVIGLASVIIGEVVFGISSLLRRLIAVVLGSVLYRLIIAIALEIGMPATDLKLVSAVIVALAMAMPIIKKRLSVVKRKSSLRGRSKKTDA
ncbi:ABC transporter permease [Desulfosporosinus sp.]|uniref:ABC transporter permease n=1 Tax=Desulfosporosinus sp. TaxID=157907 RepID=UPI000E81CF2E|nr:ABC transporter permease [Desulfosporosinus sp.]MBC2723388.1 ABC transporter permease [Desulfosporosinus sp.]MBC2724943.1 ABC transporter permease [Desulfosporosinus sp.]HBV87811.1 ABC transporter permease [Desulfosporosinus sp.]